TGRRRGPVFVDRRLGRARHSGVSRKAEVVVAGKIYQLAAVPTNRVRAHALAGLKERQHNAATCRISDASLHHPISGKTLEHLAGTLFEWRRRHVIPPSTRDRAICAGTFILQVDSAPVLEWMVGTTAAVCPCDALTNRSRSLDSHRRNFVARTIAPKPDQN